MAAVPRYAHVASVAELEMQKSELVLDAALSVLVVGIQGQIVVDALPPPPPELARSSCPP